MMFRTRTAALLITLLVPAVAGAQRSSAGSSVSAERIFEALGVREGMTVCEIGAGGGALTLAAAKLVGPAGRVYSNELGDERVKSLQEAVTRSGAVHVTVVAGEASRTNFPEAACDAVFLRDVYHHLSEPGSMNASMLAALKPGGRLAVIDFTPPNDEAPRPADRAGDGRHGVTPDTVSRELTAAGFQPVSSEDPPQRWFMVVVEKPR